MSTTATVLFRKQAASLFETAGKTVAGLGRDAANARGVAGALWRPVSTFFNRAGNKAQAQFDAFRAANPYTPASLKPITDARTAAGSTAAAVGDAAVKGAVVVPAAYGVSRLFDGKPSDTSATAKVEKSTTSSPVPGSAGPGVGAADPTAPAGGAPANTGTPPPLDKGVMGWAGDHAGELALGAGAAGILAAILMRRREGDD